jgi:hypothetical protein
MRRGQFCIMVTSRSNPALRPQWLARPNYGGPKRGRLTWTDRPPRYGPGWDSFRNADEILYFHSLTDIAVYLRRYQFDPDDLIRPYGPTGVIDDEY